MNAIFLVIACVVAIVFIVVFGFMYVVIQDDYKTALSGYRRSRLKEELDLTRNLFLVTVPILLISFTLLYSFPERSVRNLKELEVYIEDQTAFVCTDQEVNLNEKFGCNFEEGDKIKWITTKGEYNGPVFHPATTRLVK